MLLAVTLFALGVAVAGAFWLIGTTWGRSRGPLWVIGFFLLPIITQIVYVGIYLHEARVRKAGALFFGALALAVILAQYLPEY